MMTNDIHDIIAAAERRGGHSLSIDPPDPVEPGECPECGGDTHEEQSRDEYEANCVGGVRCQDCIAGAGPVAPIGIFLCADGTVEDDCETCEGTAQTVGCGWSLYRSRYDI